MKKGYLISIIGIIIFVILVTIGVGIYINTNSKLEEKETNNTQKNQIEENLIDSNIDLVQTTSEEEKISPNCVFIFKVYYKECEHITIDKETASEVMVNKTREEIESIYKDWNVVTFRNDEVLFYKEEEGICREHYILKELEGCIAIYSLDEEEKETLKEKTAIITTYLPEEDVSRLKEGIRVDGIDKLNKALEDYE